MIRFFEICSKEIVYIALETCYNISKSISILFSRLGDYFYSTHRFKCIKKGKRQQIIKKKKIPKLICENYIAILPRDSS